MKPRELKKLGLNRAQVRLAGLCCERASAAGLKALEIRARVHALIANPSAHRDDPHFGVLATMMTPGAFNDEAQPAPWQQWGEDLDPQSIRQMANAARLPVAVRGALMPDAHVGYGLPIGGVLATRDAVIPYAVGVDIACRMRLTIVDMPADAIRLDRDRLIKVLEEETRFGMGACFAKPHDHGVMSQDWGITRTTKNMKQKARSQLGSSGSGNHFVEWGVVTLDRPDLGLEPGEYLALLSHSGSRGAGAAVADYYSTLARELHPELPEELQHLAWLDMDSEAGQEYWAAMNLMGDYAAANHEVIHREMLRALGAGALHVTENHHNFCIPGDVPVATPRGPVAMGELKAGDEVYALDPEQGLCVTRVVRQWSTGVQPVRRIETEGRSLRATATHPILTVVGKGKKAALAWRPAGELVKGDVIVCAQGYGAEDGPESAELARLFGAFLGGGWIDGERAGAFVGDWQLPHVTPYRELAQRVFPDGEWISGPSAPYGISCTSAAVCARLEALGFVSAPAERALPRWAFSMSRAAKLALLAGYMDAGGRIEGAGKGQLSAANPALVEALRELAISAGLAVSSVQIKVFKLKTPIAPAHYAHLMPSSMVQLPVWSAKMAVTTPIIGPGLPAAKLGAVTLPAGAFAQKIKTITEEDPVEVFDLEVEDSAHSFIAAGVAVHNCWREEHDGEQVYVHRKGATPAGEGVMGIIPGSMASPAYVVRGRGSAASLRSASHGAGRVMSRRQAQRDIDWKATERLLAERDVTLLSAGIDEAPGVYKDIQSVMNAQQDLVDIVARFMPKIVKMAPSGEPPED